MADIETGIQGVIQSLQPSPVNYTDQTNLQNQAVQSGAINIANQIRQQQIADASAKLYSQQLGTALSSDPNSIEHKQAIYNLMALNPQFAEGGKAILSNMSEDAANQHIKDVTAFHGYVNNNQYDNALNLAQSIRDTDAKQGKDTTLDDQVINLTQRAQSGDTNAAKQLSTIAGTNLASILGPEKYASYVGLPADIAVKNAQALKDTATANTLIPAQAQQASAEANKANAEATPTGIPVTTNSGETVIVNPKTGQQLSNVDQQSQGIAAANSADAALQSFMGSEFNPNGSVNQQPILNGKPASSAKGPSQAIDSTWIQSLAQNHPELFKGLNQTQIDNIANNGSAAQAFSKSTLGQQLVGLKTNPQLAQETASNINKANINTLATQYNLPPTYALAAMAYKLGPAGAAAVAKASDNTPLSKLLSPAALKANPTIANLNVGQYEQLIHAQIAKTGADPNTPISVNSPNATGKTLLQTLPTGLQAQVQKILSGDEQAPSQRGDTSPKGMYLEGLLARVDPTYTNNRYQLKQDLYNPDTKIGGEKQALNNIVDHLHTFTLAAMNRNAGAGPVGNFIGNVTAGVFNNSGPTSKAVSNMKADATRISSETNHLFGENNELATKAQANQLNPSDDTSKNLSNASNLADLALTKLHSMMDNFSQATHMQANVNDFISPSNLAKLQHIQQLASQASNKPNQQAVALLQSKAFEKVPGTNQTYAQKFEQTYGPGSAAQYLH